MNPDTESEKKVKGLFVGLCTKDILYYTDDIPAHNHKSKTEDFATYIGGPAANAAITYAALGEMRPLPPVPGTVRRAGR